LDDLLNAATFVIGILGDSKALSAATSFDDAYIQASLNELGEIATKVTDSGLTDAVRLLLIYVPLATKDSLVMEFDKMLKGLQ
jgi:hypothetical protein